MLVKDVMTQSPVACNPNDTLENVAILMREHDCGVIPVCVERKAIGVVTDRDLTCRGVAAGKPLATPIRELMSQPVHCVAEDASVETAIDIMKTKQVRRLPVINADGKVVGIVAPSDLAPTFASMDVADFLLAVSYWSHPHAA